MTQQLDNDRDFRQLTGAFDRPVAPSPAFAERLKQRLTETQHEQGAPTMQAPTQLHATRMTAKSVIAMPEPGRRLVRILEAAAAAILILALIGAGFFVNRNGNDTDGTSLRLAAVTGTPSPDETMPVAIGANGTTAYFPDSAFDVAMPMGYSTKNLGDPTQSIIRSIDASGNYLIQNGMSQGSIGQEASSSLWVSDAHTGDVIWTSPGNYLRRVTITSDTIYAVQVVPNQDNPTGTLVALSLTTGEQRFSSPILTHLSGGSQVAPVVIGDSVFLADAIGTTYALDAKTGEQMWMIEGQPSRDADERSTGGALVATSDAIFVATGANTLRKLDIRNGSLLYESQPLNSAGTKPFEVALYRSGNHIIARVMSTPTDDDTHGNVVHMIPETIIELDAKTGDTGWSHEFPDIAGEIAVTSDRIYVPTRQTGRDPIDVQILDIEDGSMHNMPHLSDARTANLTATGSAGHTLILLDSDSRVQILTVPEPTEWSVLYDHNLRSIPGEGQPPSITISDGKAYTADETGQVIMLEPDTLPDAATPSASPEISTSGFQPDYKSTGDLTVNLRWGPGIRYDVATTIPPETPLQFLGESEPTRHPEEDGLAGDQDWMKVRTRNGEEGWIREVDITGYMP